MAELDVQPKKRSGSILPWILLALGILALLFYFLRGRDGDDAVRDADRAADSTGAAVSNAANTVGEKAENAADNVREWWNNIDWNAPAAKWDEITNKDIDVRGNDKYGIYAVNETILFDEGKSDLRSGAESNLREIASSIGKRYSGSNVRVYGYTDAVGSASYNKELAEKRAEAVKNWLVKNGNVTESNISVHPVGESRPVASNNTEAGRQQNRRVEIVASANK